MVEMAIAPLERSGEGHMVWSAPQTIQNLQMGHGVGRGLQVYRRRRWLCGYQRRRQFLQNLERARSCSVETEVHQMPRGPKCVRHAGGTWSGLVLMGGGGVDWLPLASHGSRGPERQRLREREREREKESKRFGEHLAPLSLYQTKLCPCSGTVLDVVGQ